MLAQLLYRPSLPTTALYFGGTLDWTVAPAKAYSTITLWLPAAAGKGTEKRDVDGDGGVCSLAAYDAARSIILVVRGLVVKGSRVGAPRKQRCAEPVVD
eukprot:scaffold90493_cov63-Phaeocystis_antarctica.AAC.3